MRLKINTYLCSCQLDVVEWTVLTSVSGEKSVLWTGFISFGSCEQENQFSVTMKAGISWQIERLSTFHEGISGLN